MAQQNYTNHTQRVLLYHVLLAILFLTWIGSFVNLYGSWGDHTRIYSASLITVLVTAVIILAYLARVFPLKAQDRAIRAEENLRHYVLAGKLLDSRLSLKQVIALRFAGDEEFVALARRAAADDLSPDAIKRAVQNWRADTHRV